MIIADTSALVALMRSRDADHARTSAVLLDLQRVHERFVVPEPVATETSMLLRGRGRTDLARRLWRAMLDGAMDPIPMGPKGLALAYDLDARYADADLGFVDCCVLATCERERCARVFTLDAGLAVHRPTFAPGLELLP